MLYRLDITEIAPRSVSSIIPIDAPTNLDSLGSSPYLLFNVKYIILYILLNI